MARTRAITSEDTGPSRTIPLDLFDAIAIEEVSDPLWKRILDTIGYPAGLSSRTFTTKALLDRLNLDGASEELIDVLRTINELGTDDGVEAMKQVADAHTTDLGTITQCAARDAAAELWLAQNARPELREVYARVQMQVEARRSPRSFREYCGKEARRAADWNTLKSRIVAGVSAWCRTKDFGEHVDVRGYVTNGDLQMQVIHGHRIQKPVIVRDNGQGRRVVELRPAHCDVIRYDAKGSWLRISPRSTGGGVFDAYRTLLGIALFDDADFFSPAGYSLRSLQERGQAALEACPSVSRARVTDLVWDRGSGVIRIKSPDCLAEVQAMGLAPTEGDFIEARIAVTLPGRCDTRRAIHIKLPNKVDYPRDDVHAVAIGTFLEASGICTTEAPRRSRDVWDLYPWKQTERTWRDAYPDDVDPLVQRQILKATEFLRVVHSDHPTHGRALAVDAGFGVSSDEDVPPRVLTPTDIGGLALDVTSLLAGWRETLGLEGTVRDLGDGIYLLGERSFESVRFAIAVLIRQPTDDGTLIARRISTAVTHGSTIAVLVPTGRKSGTGHADVALDRLCFDEHEVWRQVMVATAVGAQVPAIWRAPRNVRLVVDRTRMLVWLDGVPINVTSDSGAYRFIAMLAEARNCPVANDAIDAALSPNRDESSARKVKSAAKKALETSLALAGRSIDADNILVNVRGQGYKLAVPAYVG